MSARQLLRAERWIGEVSMVLLKYGVLGCFAIPIALLAYRVATRVNLAAEIEEFLTYYATVLAIALLVCIIGQLAINTYLAVARRKRNWAMIVLLLGSNLFCGSCFVQVVKWAFTLL
jgi:uncharacterized membrane protein YgdD (TMEM256/DUF423 family)